MALYVVQGPPAAGKTTWVQQRAKHGDIVIDLDAIAAALTPDAGHNHPTAVLRCARQARRAAIDEAFRHSGDVDVYVIHALPSAKAVTMYAEHGARMVTIDPGRDVVEQRIAEQRPRSTLAFAARWYAQLGSPEAVALSHDDHGQAAGSRSW